ncbi:hypothetical protein L249_6814 [Ophiocordyceps polyrhachis-furcata BCC 54312]|uniref:DUF6987 domain-containing protein n=1 Tax=Ophiocordyceps polyrhachis-furcata BCC 54312 TaxID=1330021 RepID=A0A367LJU4_9HYPO|nr:hypothetical protein L249_6814 [Ophiocordyceps polyrhachis-furcata BCC 54312]
MPVKNPFSVPGSWGKDTGEATSTTNNSEAIPRNAAGIVGKSGDILDQSGKSIGNVSDAKDAEALAGSAVTTTGDIINASGDIVGKASLESEYTTRPDSKSGGWNVLGKTKGVIQTVDSIRGPVNKSFELAGNLSNLQGKSGDKASGVEGGEDDHHSAASKGERKDAVGNSAVKSSAEGQGEKASSISKTDSVADADHHQQQQQQPAIRLQDNDDGSAATDRGTAKHETSAASTVGKHEEKQADEPLAVQDPVPIDEKSETGVKSEPLKPADSVSEHGSGTVEKDPSSAVAPASEQVKSEARRTDVAPPEAGHLKGSSDLPAEQQSSELAAELQSRKGTEKATSEQAEGKASTTGLAADQTKEAAPSELGSAKMTTKSMLSKATGEADEATAAKAAKGEATSEQAEGKASSSSTTTTTGLAADQTKEVAPSELGSAKITTKSMLSKATGEADETAAAKGEAPSDLGSQRAADKAPSTLGSVKASSEKVPSELGPEKAHSEAEEAQGEEVKVEPSSGDATGQGGEEGEAMTTKDDKEEAVMMKDDEEEEKKEAATIKYGLLRGTKVNKSGKLVDSDGDVIGKLVEGDVKKLVGKMADEEGYIKDQEGNKLGRGEPLADDELPEGLVDELSKKKEEEEKKKKEEEEEEEPTLDYSVLKGTKVNKAGNLVDGDGDIVGRLVEGEAKQLIGRRADEEGYIWNDSGKKVGRGEPIADAERDAAKSFAPFENFPDAVVEADGRVTSEGRQVGTVVEGDPKRLKGSKVDEDGDILDRRGNVVGKAEAWDEPEPPPEEEPERPADRSALAGKRVNKAGNVVDSAGVIYGRVVEGDVASLVGRMCNRDGNVMSESGEVIGRAELVPEHEREGRRDGPFADLVGCTVTKDGKVVTSAGDVVVGRLTSGDGKTLYGRRVDQDGDVVDRNGNVLGKAERWEEPVVEKKRDALAGRRVNRDGNVVDEDGNIIGRLISGDVAICSGKEVDDDGDVINSKGMTIGHVSRLEDIPPEPEVEEPEPEVEEEEESAEEKEKREQAEKDRKLAGQLSAAIEQSLDRIRPVCKMILDKIERAERTPKEELDEEQLVREVKPLIEEGHRILTETNGVIRGLDPDGRIQRNAKAKAGTREATPEEHHLAEVLKELTGTISETIDKARRMIDGMPHAKKELNPLWGLLSEPLFQILAAVGLLLNGVLGLVGRLLSGLGLGGLIDNLLGGLGLNKILGSLGLGGALDALTGKKKK